VPLSNTSTVYAEPCAEHVLAMMTSVSRRLPQALDNQRREHAWGYIQVREHIRLLRGQRALVLGLGAIGRRVIELLAPLRMDVVAVRRSRAETNRCRLILNRSRAAPACQADHVIDVLPGGPDTHHFLNARARIALMKPTAVVYNIGRGSTIDQVALQRALAEGRLGAACIDVTEPEPLPPDAPVVDDAELLHHPPHRRRPRRRVRARRAAFLREPETIRIGRDVARPHL
jgi:phosphoglycerate dehydrogenase-like enzyme